MLREFEEIKVIKALKQIEPDWSCSKITKATHKIVKTCRQTGQDIDEFLEALVNTKWELED